MTEPDINTTTYQALEQRVGDIHLRRRLGVESDHARHVFGGGRTFFHIENWYSIHTWLRVFLKLTGLHARGRRNALDIRVRHHELPLPRLHPVFDGFKILHLSDLHLDINDSMPDALIAAIRDLDYDLCVLTGDYKAWTHGICDAALAGLKRVHGHLTAPAYAVLGNHDSIHMVPHLEAMGIRILLNESVAIERQGHVFQLAGIDDPHYYKADNLEKAASAFPRDAPSILLAHSPEIYRHAAHTGFDVLLCGHTHGGQICLPGGIPLMVNADCPRSLCSGPWQYHEMLGYTSTGAGCSVVDVRLNCPAEVTLHHLRALPVAGQ